MVWKNYLKLIVLKVYNFPLKLLKYYKKLLPVVEQKEPMYSKFLIVTQIKVIKFGFGFLFIDYKRTLTLQNKLFFSFIWLFTNDIVQKIFQLWIQYCKILRKSLSETRKQMFWSGCHLPCLFKVINSFCISK